MIDQGLARTLAAIIHSEKPQLSPTVATSLIKHACDGRAVDAEAGRARWRWRSNAPHETVSDRIVKIGGFATF
jgi:hypothetical protein